jgi:cytidylate kinase
MISVIAIDGPAGCGKSTVAKKIARKLGWLYFDTGAMYRAITLKCIKEKIDFNNNEEIISIAEKIDMFFKNSHIFLDNKDVSLDIRTPLVTSKVSIIAGITEVRNILVEMQRKIANNRECAVEGRDTTSVVFPDAKYKFYLDASIEERVKRRANEFKEKNIDFDKDKLRLDIEDRDSKDIGRENSPLRVVDDAVYIDTSDLSEDEVVEKVLGYVKMEII